MIEHAPCPNRCPMSLPAPSPALTAADLLAKGHTPMMAHYPRMTYKFSSILKFFR